MSHFFPPTPLRLFLRFPSLPVYSPQPLPPLSWAVGGRRGALSSPGAGPEQQLEAENLSEGLDSWEILKNGGDGWRIETIPGDYGRAFHDLQIQKYFVTSYGQCKKSQIIDLKQEGYWEELMDVIQPDIEIKDWYAARQDCGCQYELCVQLLSKDYIVRQQFCPEVVIIEQWSDAQWTEVTHTFKNYGPGVRYICFQHGGKDTQFWAGWYGVRLTDSSVAILPEELM
ncbi:F-box only protein 44 isoform X2 [Microcaecilia unicolor]|uniref:F-box only protein 6-like isoform X2 n=1 Tax=Microcaecilia unicolor TaxID=1415580 RepID=A0A6P7WF78_9AMPH|nr:F-box only protein 6-like isoform X2 [Microcaecilia unicolor]